MSDVVIFDTSILIDELRTGRHRERIQSISALIRTSAVVLAELWRGATEAAEREFLRTLAKNHPILTPTEKNWLESGDCCGRGSPNFVSPRNRSLVPDLLGVIEPTLEKFVFAPLSASHTV